MESDEPTVFWLRWARPDGKCGAHSGTPTVSECEADGYHAVGGDPRYPTVLMRRDEATNG